MRKRLAGLFTALAAAATLCAVIPAAACNPDNGDNGENPTPPAEQLYDKLELSSQTQFGFEADLEGWTAVNESAAWQADGKTGAPVVYMGDGAVIANKFAVGADSRYALVNLNVKGDGDALFKAYAEYADGSEIKKADLEIANTKAIEKDGEGYYKLGPSTISRLAFDLREYKNQLVAVYFEQKGQNGLEINSIAIVRDPNTATAETEWTAAQIATGWEMRGNASYKEGALQLYNRGKTAAVYAEVRITSDLPYLKIEAKNGANGAGELALYANGELIQSENTLTDYAQTSAGYSEYLYDLYDYAGQTTQITVAAQSGSVQISGMEFVNSKLGYSKATDWDQDEIYKSWISSGNVNRHSEGFCLENFGRESSITNIVPISEDHCYLNISFRIFVRPEGQAQDTPPKIGVFVNERLIRSVGSVNDYVTCNTDEYKTFAYDLSEFVGSSVTIKIVNVEGTHACFNRIYLDDTPEVEQIKYPSEQYTAESLSALQTLMERTFEFAEDACGWTLGNGGGEYDGAKWIASGRTGSPCINLDGSDLGDSTNFMPNAWLVGKFELGQNDKYLTINATGSAGNDTYLRVRLITVENGQIVSVPMTDYDKETELHGYYLIDDSSPSKYVFDITEFNGKTVYISIELDDDGEGSGEIINVYGVKITATQQTYSQFTEWTADTMDSDWEKHGDVVKHSEGLCLENQGDPSSITNTVQVLQGKGYFKIAIRKFVRTEGLQDTDPQVKLYVNDTLIKAIGVDTDYVTTSGEAYEEFWYDLTAYEGQTVTVKLENAAGQHACFNGVEFATENGSASKLTEWDIDALDSDWEKFADVNKHNEGLCIENQGRNSSITNKVRVPQDKGYLKIAFRKFVRGAGEEQDTDPHIKLYVNGTVVKAIGAAEDYVTTSGEAYEEFVYDLSQFKGQIVVIKLESVAGQHACFNKVAFSAEGVQVSQFDEWDIDKLDGDWTKNGDVVKHNEGLCLENQGNPSSITNTVQISQDKANLKIAFRKFVRGPGEAQDTDPQIKLYVNGTLIRADAAQEDFVTTSGEDYAEFVYDLSQFKGQTVVIKIENVAGQHACFNSVAFTA